MSDQPVVNDSGVRKSDGSADDAAAESYDGCANDECQSYDGCKSNDATADDESYDESNVNATADDAASI